MEDPRLDLCANESVDALDARQVLAPHPCLLGTGRLIGARKCDAAADLLWKLGRHRPPDSQQGHSGIGGAALEHPVARFCSVRCEGLLAHPASEAVGAAGRRPRALARCSMVPYRDVTHPESRRVKSRLWTVDRRTSCSQRWASNSPRAALGLSLSSSEDQPSLLSALPAVRPATLTSWRCSPDGHLRGRAHCRRRWSRPATEWRGTLGF